MLSTRKEKSIFEKFQEVFFFFLFWASRKEFPHTRCLLCRNWCPIFRYWSGHFKWYFELFSAESPFRSVFPCRAASDFSTGGRGRDGAPRSRTWTAQLRKGWSSGHVRARANGRESPRLYVNYTTTGICNWLARATLMSVGFGRRIFPVGPTWFLSTSSVNSEKKPLLRRRRPQWKWEGESFYNSRFLREEHNECARIYVNV